MKEVIEFLTAIIIVLILVVLEGFIVALVWNYVMPYVFGLPTINYLQALALELLGTCLFKTTYTSKKGE